MKKEDKEEFRYFFRLFWLVAVLGEPVKRQPENARVVFTYKQCFEIYLPYGKD